MNRLFVTGDMHCNACGEFSKLNTKNFPVQKELSKDDYILIAGDFGCIWNGSMEEEYWLDWLENKPFTTLFVDGNHENHARLAQFPVEEWHGGKVHRIRSSILHLMRGQIFDIAGLKVFAMGGASSHDIRDGISPEARATVAWCMKASRALPASVLERPHSAAIAEISSVFVIVGNNSFLCLT